MIREEYLEVVRTARYAVMGSTGSGVREVWFVLHGYGQLASRFLQHFAVLEHEARLLVAPEGLSRFYIDPEHVRGAAAMRVGASWMTREDREVEIGDYLKYLDAVAAHVLTPLRGSNPRIIVLGFSQGVATACRWAVLGRTRTDRLLLWAGGVPPDLDFQHARERLGPHGLTLVVGTADSYIPDGAVEREKARLAEQRIPYQLKTFPGGHEIDPAILTELANEV